MELPTFLPEFLGTGGPTVQRIIPPTKASLGLLSAGANLTLYETEGLLKTYRAKSALAEYTTKVTFYG